MTFEVLAASKVEQLKSQIKGLLDYKDSYHICLLGLDRNEVDTSEPGLSSTQGSNSVPDRGAKISIRQFHECVLRFLITELIKQGFKYVSTLPGGFQQVHDLSHVYGFQLINHEELFEAYHS